MGERFPEDQQLFQTSNSLMTAEIQCSTRPNAGEDLRGAQAAQHAVFTGASYGIDAARNQFDHVDRAPRIRKFLF
jgi:hypothetical protein